MANEERLLTALTTEHFTLATARSTAVSESSARATIYLLSVSTTLVAIGFVSQLSAPGNLFEVFTLTVLPTLFVLGLFTFLRLTEISVEDFRYGQAINRIRHYYLELAGDRANYFVLSGSDDRAGVWANMSLRPSRWHSHFTMPMAIAFINTVVGASAVALATGVAADFALGGALASGAAFAVLSFALHYRHNENSFERATAGTALFPSANTRLVLRRLPAEEKAGPSGRGDLTGEGVGLHHGWRERARPELLGRELPHGLERHG